MGVFSIIADNFTILRNRNIRVYLSGNAVSLIGDWMQQTAQAWVVWELTHSTVALGIVAFFGQIPFFILGPWVGVVSDRYDRRKILLVTQFLIMLCAFALAGLLQAHVLRLWHVYALACVLGIVSAFDVTAEQAFISDIAGAGNIRKAVALNNSITQLTRLAGPSIAGYLISKVGVALSFWLNGLTIIICILSIAAVHTRSTAQATSGNGLKQFLEGWRYFRKHSLLKLIMVFAATQAFFGLSTIQLLPAVASDILKGNAATLGKLLGAAGAGALIGIVFVMPFVERIKRPCMAIGGALIWSGAWYIFFSRSSNIYLTLACQFMTSMGAANVVTLAIGLSQELTPPGMRARIVSTFLMIIFGLQPVASWLVGAGAHRWGLQPMILVNGILMVVVPAILLTLPRLHQLRRPEATQKGQDHCVGF